MNSPPPTQTRGSLGTGALIVFQDCSSWPCGQLRFSFSTHSFCNSPNLLRKPNSNHQKDVQVLSPFRKQRIYTDEIPLSARNAALSSLPVIRSICSIICCAEIPPARKFVSMNLPPPTQTLRLTWIYGTSANCILGLQLMALLATLMSASKLASAVI
ncbi:hypothetical protein CEXT_792111 [Caerostris extrusa]|uniref:Uncharacterized protein n=1 Tax=Caerostris extrusa TaxID=172846 RepID=A0AAV4TDA4_CAEEX|nr:hypothetical protein CEXT_792111 [Caerostris extrusa]